MDFLRIFILAGIAGIAFGALSLSIDLSAILYFSEWRMAPILENPSWILIFFNNILVIFLTLFGASLLTYYEIESYERLPERVYDFLELLSRPLDWPFALFDRRILGMKKPMRASYFISKALPVLIVAANSFLLFWLYAYSVFALDLGIFPALAYFLRIFFPIGLIEFSSMLVAAAYSYRFVESNIELYEKRKTRKLKKKLKEFLLAKENWKLYALLSVPLLFSAVYESITI